jgi:O-antigen ligase
MERVKVFFNYILNKLGYLFGMFVFVPNRMKPYLVLILFLTCLITCRIVNIKKLITSALPMLVLFFMYLFSLFYTSDLNLGIVLIIRMFPMIILPFSFSVIGTDNTEVFFSNFKKTFIFSLVAYSLFILFYLYKLDCLFGNNSLNYGYSYITNEFYGFNDHPIYISSYYCLGLLIIIYEKKKNIIFSIFSFSIILFGLILLSRKGSIIAFIAVLIYYIVLNKKQLFKISFIIIASLLFIFSIPEVKNRFLELTKSEKKLTTSTGIRELILENAFKLTSKCKFIGFGAGSVQKELNKEYYENKNYSLVKENYNAHNQYLQIVLTIGFIGLFIFLAAMIYLTIHLHFNKNYFGVAVLIYFYILFSTESYLQRQNGIFFFSLILSLIIFSEKEKTNKFNFWVR